MRITEVDFHIRGHREGFVFCHLQPAVPRHWEGDLIGGTKNSHIATLVERHSRFTALVKVRSKDTAAVVAAVSRQIRKLPASLRRSLTGNGAVLDFCGPFPDGDGINDLTAGLSGDTRVRRAAYAALGSQVPHQLFLQHSSRLQPCGSPNLRKPPEFRPRNNVTGLSACYSFQPHFEFWRRTTVEVILVTGADLPFREFARQKTPVSALVRTRARARRKRLLRIAWDSNRAEVVYGHGL